MNIISREINSKCKIDWIVDVLSLGAVLQYCVYRFLQSTMFVIYFSQTYKILTMALLLVFGGSRYLYILVRKWNDKDQNDRRRFVLKVLGAWLLALPFFYVGWLHDYKVLVFLPICCMCLYEMVAEKVFKAFAFTIGTLLLATILCCLSGTVRNLVQTYPGGNIVGAYGFINTTDFASYFTFLWLIIWCSLEDRGLTFSLLFATIVGTITYIVYIYTESRTSLYSGILIVISIVAECAISNLKICNKNLQKRINQASRLTAVVFPFIGVIILIATFLYAQNNSVLMQIDNNQLSERIKTIWVPYNQYGIHAFGSQIASMHGKGGTIIPYWTSGYSYIDVAYAMLAIRYGWVITVIFCGFWVRMTLEAQKRGNYRIAISLAILSLHGFSEARILDLNYNILLAMPFCLLGDAKKKTQERLKVSKDWVPIATAITIVGLFYMVFPRVLSMLRTFYYVNNWNHGCSTLFSLIWSVVLVTLLWVLWLFVNNWLIKKNRIHAIMLCVSCFLIIGFVLNINNVIQKIEEDAVDDSEKKIIRMVQETASLPVYAAEKEEIYNRTIGGFRRHIFSTDELGRAPGTIIVDGDIEAFGVIFYGGQYTQLSEEIGLYSLDEDVIKKIAVEGYEWKPYYSGVRRIDLNDTSIFNELDLKSSIAGPVMIETKNSEIDHYGGNYEVTFHLSSEYSSQINLLHNEICELIVFGEAGDVEIAREKLYLSDFDSDGNCFHTISYSTWMAKVSYGIEIKEGSSIQIKEISWKKVS